MCLMNAIFIPSYLQMKYTTWYADKIQYKLGVLF